MQVSGERIGQDITKTKANLDGKHKILHTVLNLLGLLQQLIRKQLHIHDQLKFTSHPREGGGEKERERGKEFASHDLEKTKEEKERKIRQHLQPDSTQSLPAHTSVK